MLAGMVVHMARPEPANAVGETVEPVIGEVVEHECDWPSPPDETEVEDSKLVEPQRQRKHCAAERQTRNRASQAKGE